MGQILELVLYFSSGTVIRKDLWKHGESPFPHLIVEQICDAPAEDELY